MGLGKTCQVIAFLSHLKETGKNGPHLVVVPASTLENWLREFNRFCPSMVIEPYYGSMDERANIRDTLMESDTKYDVLVTTYNLACGGKADHSFLRSQKFNVCVYDEGHLLKNSQSERYSKLMRLKAEFRLLLTGTPLQNNLRELVSLLSFILPDIFQSRKDDLAEIFKHKAKATSKNDEDNATNANLLLSEQRISKAKTMMTPFVLRRKKDQVLNHLPEKAHAIEYCKMSDEQQSIYDMELDTSRKAIAAREAAKESGQPSGSAKNIGNILMQLRKAALHPLLFRRLYNDTILKKMAKEIMAEPRYETANEQFIYEDMEVMTDFELHRLCESFPSSIGHHKLSEDKWMTSGKISKLEKLLPQMKADGDRILIFSQFTQMLDILERVLNFMKISFLRLDGSTPVEVRQEMIDKFYEEKEITVFLLSTKAGGFGINLACANVVIIYDLSFNPHDDKQAEDRAHRVGQTREVQVIRLITKDTIEENILQLANTKLQLDRSVSDEADEEKLEQSNVSLVASMLLGKTPKASVEPE
ncbi:DNA-dependent ATPase FUN30 [Sugiyamaella lignohabitans]|uniref:DNA-dependent ATPase FUN30 n=1 Tax=Sugiyamaella lignohabitans TaxID=796027 RepID=A0A161HG36_9ASCO|nr:DNA-dependent ATPase FUN30 [Sugiyamaella lignohabitans]ANB11651.1 DNA-dependent ATPase FUN30 [Sugiyamaella lignohabitans]